MRTAVTAAVISLIASVASGNVRAYAIDPVRAEWSGKAHPVLGVSEILTCNFDSLAYVELFAGDSGSTGSGYRVGVREGGIELTHADGVQHQPTSWVRFENWSDTVAFTKGKKYEFRFTRSGSDSIQYYYDSMCGYNYGLMIAPYPPLITPDFGLAMRCYGRMNPVDSMFWGVTQEFPAWNDTALQNMWLSRAREAGVGMVRMTFHWNDMEPYTHGELWFGQMDAAVEYAHDSLGCQILAQFVGCPRWASSRRDSTWVGDTAPPLYGHYEYDTCVTCPPRNLFLPVSDSANYWARFVDTVIKRYRSRGDALHLFECGNEPNDTCSVDTLHGPPHWVTGWWQHPNIAYHDSFQGLWGLCSLYVRYCIVADSLIKGAQPDDTVLVGSVTWLEFENDETGTVAGKEWLRTCYDIASPNIFWDGVSPHAYQPIWCLTGFDPDFYQQNADTVSEIMRSHGHVAPVWNTEFSWDTAGCADSSRELGARVLNQAFVCGKASEASPSGKYDRVCWWHFRETGPEKSGSVPLLEYTMQYPYDAYYAFKQTAEHLTGKRLNGRVMNGDTAIDNCTRVYEFEDTTALKKRTWVCWQDEAVAAYTPLPVRSDTVDTVALDYDGSPPTDQRDAENSGWLHIALDPRPAFVTEKSSTSRPELVVDSVWMSKTGSAATFYAKIRNRDTLRATPDGCLTWARITWNSDSVCSFYTDQVLQPRDTLTVFFPTTVPGWMSGEGLLEADLNPGMLYVEKEGTDDNQAYQRLYIP